MPFQNHGNSLKSKLHAHTVLSSIDVAHFPLIYEHVVPINILFVIGAHDPIIFVCIIRGRGSIFLMVRHNNNGTHYVPQKFHYDYIYDNDVIIIAIVRPMIV